LAPAKDKNSKDNKIIKEVIKPLQPPWKNRLLKHVKDASESIFIISPTLKTEVIKWITNLLLDEPPEGKFNVRVMTRLNEEELIDGKSDLEALEMLSNLSLGPEFRMEFRGVENLNANVLIFDNKRIIITSGGLSNKGLTTNLEYGIYITKPKLVGKILADFEEYWSSADELKLPDLKYFISQIQEHDTSVGGFLKLGTSIMPHGKDIEDIGPLEGETLAKKYLSSARDHEEMGEYEKALDFYNKALVATPKAVDILRDKAVMLRDDLNRPDDALETFNKILTIEPKDERASLDSGVILAEKHMYWDALLKLDITTNANPSNEAAWFWKAKVLSDIPGRIEDALRCLDEVIKNDPNNEEAWYLKGSILSRYLDRFSEADRCFNTVTRINPKSEKAWVDKGKNLFLNLNKPVDSLKCFDKVTKLNKNNASGWFYKGKILAETYKKDKESLRCFSEAIRLEPDYKDALYYHGKLLATKLSEPEKAKESLEKIISNNDCDLEALFELGLLYGKELDNSDEAINQFMSSICVRLPEQEPKEQSKMDQGEKFDKFAEVLKYLDEVTVNEPRNHKAWYLKGAILDRNYSRFEDALKCYDEATKINGNFKEAWFDKAIILTSVYGRNEDAIKCLNKVISLDKRDEDAWYEKGKALMDDQKYEDALACFEKVTKLNPKNVHAYDNIANSLTNLSRLKDSIEYYDKAIKLDDKNPGYWYDKGNSYLALRKYAEALNCYKQALNINPNHELALKNFETYSDKNNWV
jgi:tetratricopeptide (TPR) repeat protein